MKPCRILLGCVLASHCLLSGSAWGQVVTEFSAGITAGAGPEGITAGPDGNLWFTESNPQGNRIGKITTAGVVTEYSSGLFAGPDSITAGPDGNLWFAEYDGSRIGKITTAGVVTEYSFGGGGVFFIGAFPLSITAGPDGNLWFTFENEGEGVFGSGITKMTTAAVFTSYCAPICDQGGNRPYGITAGPDGNLWFTAAGSRVGKITTAGVVTNYSGGISAGANPLGITAGPDGNLWFTEYSGNRIGRITPLGVVTEFSAGITAGAGPSFITAGPDGNLWFTEYNGNRIGRITPSGVVTEFSSGITPGAQPLGITAGPDGNLWFTEYGGNRIGRITTGAGIAPPTDIPALQRWALWLLGVLILIATAGVRLRPRKND